jgi:hypothetical protein
VVNEDINEKERERERHSSVNKQIKTTTVELNGLCLFGNLSGSCYHGNVVINLFTRR